MPQNIIFFDDEEDKKVKDFAEKINLSKAETLRKIIKYFDYEKQELRIAEEVKNSKNPKEKQTNLNEVKENDCKIQ